MKNEKVLRSWTKLQTYTWEIVFLQQIMGFCFYIQQEEHIGLCTWINTSSILLDVHHQNSYQIILLKGMENVFLFRNEKQRKTQLLCFLLFTYLVSNQNIENRILICCITFIF